jgi:hypothetical protein
MPRKGVRDLAKEQQWRAVMQEWQASGESGAAFCRRHGYRYFQFQDWQRIIRARDEELAADQRKVARTKSRTNRFERGVKLTAQPKSSAIGFVPANITDARSDISALLNEAKIEVVLPCGIVVRSTSACSPNFLSSVVASLENR